MTDQTPQEGELILYRAANDAVRVEVLYESETFWPRPAAHGCCSVWRFRPSATT